MLSLTCKIAIKAVIYLASISESEEKTSIKEIAEFINASEHTVGKLLQKLVKEEVINSAKGPTGGFYITTMQMSQSIMRIVNAIDGNEVFDQCGLGFKKCSATHPCPLHNDYKIIRDQYKAMCIQTKISNLCEIVNDGVAYLIG